jgi:survival of motor neuron protein-interacting protein 1
MGHALHNYDHTDEEEEENSVGSQVSENPVPTEGFDPNTKLISQFDDILVRRVLSHHLHYIKEGYEISFNRGRWLYGLLARLQKPLHREEASLLIDLLRELCMIRKRSNGGDESLKMLNTLIVIIGIYFEQCCNIDVLMKPPSEP